jgi:hypothetical protein
MFDPTFTRAGVLWTAIINFIQTAEGNVAIKLESFVAKQLIRNPPLDSGQKKLLVHRFAIEGEVEGKTPLDLFLASSSDLTNADRQLIQSWRKSFVGLIEIVEIYPNGLEVMNWLTAKHYRIQFTDLPAQTAMIRLKVGEIIIAQLSPIVEIDWAILTPWIALGKLGKPKLAVAVGAFRQNYPHYLYPDASELLAASWESVAVYHDRFVEFFGSDEITLTGTQLQTRMGEFQEWMVAKQLDAAGVDRTKSLADLAADAGLAADDLDALTSNLGLPDSGSSQGQATAMEKMISPQIELPSQLKTATIITALSHPYWGQMFLADYSRLKILLAATDSQYLHADLNFMHKCLADPLMNAFVWRRLAAEFPQQLATAIEQLLDYKYPQESNSESATGFFNLDAVLTKFNKYLEPDLPDLASVPIHLHNLFQAAVIDVSKAKAKPKSQPKKSGFGAKS